MSKLPIKINLRVQVNPHYTLMLEILLIIVLVALLFGARAAKGCLFALLVALAILVVLVCIGIYLTVPFN